MFIVKQLKCKIGGISPGITPSSCRLLCSIQYTVTVQRLSAYLHARAAPPYVVNLDPAVHEVPYPANIGRSHDNHMFVL